MCCKLIQSNLNNSSFSAVQQLNIMQLLMKRERILVDNKTPVTFDHKLELDELYTTFASTLSAVETELPYVIKSRNK